MLFSHHRHSGRYLPHHHTSYAALAFIVLCAGIVLATSTASTLAVENPQSGSVALTGTMPGPPPTAAATILVPSAGQRFTSLPITVSGTCTAGLVVQIFKNDIFGGSTVCNDSGGYSLQIDLFAGTNTLVARIYDALDQAGPDSAPVSVIYAPTSQFGNFINDVKQPLFIRSDATTRGASPNVLMTWNYEIIGGKSPYAVSIDWGDGKTDLISQQTAGSGSAQHSYVKPGNYQVVIKVTDSVGTRAYLQATIVVNGPLGSSTKSEPGTALLTAWPLYGFAMGLVLSFWLGEKFDAWQVKRNGSIPPPAPA